MLRSTLFASLLSVALCTAAADDKPETTWQDALKEILPTIPRKSQGTLCSVDIAGWAESSYRNHMQGEAQRELSQLDTNNDGSISVEEVQAATGSLEPENVDAIMRRFHKFDADKNGSLNLEELIEMLLHTDADPEAIEHAAKTFMTDGDIDKDNRLSKDELLDILVKENESLRSHVDPFMTLYDEDKDGFLSLKELEKLIYSENQKSLGTPELRSDAVKTFVKSTLESGSDYSTNDEGDICIEDSKIPEEIANIVIKPELLYSGEDDNQQQQQPNMDDMSMENLMASIQELEKNYPELADQFKKLKESYGDGDMSKLFEGMGENMNLGDEEFEDDEDVDMEDNDNDNDVEMDDNEEHAQDHGHDEL